MLHSSCTSCETFGFCIYFSVDMQFSAFILVLVVSLTSAGDPTGQPGMVEMARTAISTAGSRVKGLAQHGLQMASDNKLATAGIVTAGVLGSVLGYKYLRDKRLKREAAEKEMLENDKLTREMNSKADAAQPASPQGKPSFFSGLNLVLIVVGIVFLLGGAYYYTQG